MSVVNADGVRCSAAVECWFLRIRCYSCVMFLLSMTKQHLSWSLDSSSMYALYMLENGLEYVVESIGACAF